MTAALHIEGLRVSHRGAVVAALDARVEPGEVLTVMGPSGSGKSTLLGAILGSAAPDFSVTGRILLGARDVSDLAPHRRRIGLLFQDHILFPHLSVAENLAFALPPDWRGRAVREAQVQAALEQAGLPGFGPRDPDTLSGGERARVALMRALLANPCALLLDEPFSRLDSALRDQIRGFVLTTLRARSIPAILVTHDVEDARAAAGRIVNAQGESLPPA